MKDPCVFSCMPCANDDIEDTYMQRRTFETPEVLHLVDRQLTLVVATWRSVPGSAIW